MSASGPSSTHEKTISSIGVELYHAIDKLDDSNVKRILANDPLPPWEDIKPTLETLSDDGTPEALLKKVAHSNEFIFDQVINAYFEFFNDELIRSLLILFVENNNHAALCEYLPYSSDALLYTHFKSLISLAARNKNLDILDTLIQETQTDTATEYWAITAVYDVLLTAVKTQDVDFLNDILKKLPLPLIRQEVPSVLETICFYYPNEDDSIKALLLSPISDEIRILRLSSAITQNSLNIVQLILPTITAISDRSLISIIRKARYNKDIYQMIKAHYKNQIIKMLSEQLTSLNITDNIAQFSKLIFLPRQNSIHLKDPWIASICNQTIYNNDGYTTDVQFSEAKGRPLTLQIKHQSSPIGYTIELPEDEVKAVIIDVYGGFSRDDFEEYYQKLKEFKDKTFELAPRLDNRLRQEGIAIVHANLCDLLELKVFQAQMPEPLFRKIHRSIHCLYEILQDHPESLHPALSSLKGLPFFLRGASFGGLMCVRYAQLASQYPLQFRRFQGYLSFNGVLSGEMQHKSDLPYIYDQYPRDYRADFLNPYNHISFIEDPILVTQCLDDNNVNAKVAFDFVQKAHECGKGHLVRLQLVQNGNKLLKNYPLREEAMKGHLAVDRFELKVYSDAVLQFIKQPVSNLPEVSSWRQFYGNIQANEYYRQATPLDKFIAHFLNRRKAKRTIDLIAEIQDDETWHTHYKPLYLAYRYVYQLCSSPSQLAEDHQFNEHLTDEVIINAFHDKAAAFLTYIFEAHDIENLIVHDIDAAEFIRLPLIINTFREALQHIDDNFHFVSARFLLEQLYVNNPHLIPTPSAVVSCSTSAGHTEVDSHCARTQLLSALQMDRSYILSLWKRTIDLSKRTRTLASGACSSNIETSSKKHSLISRLSYDRKCKRMRH